MTAYIFYLLKLSISLGVVWLFYQLFLRRLTFYTWNRWYLLVYSLVCFLIPLIDIRLFIKEDLPGAPSFAGEIPVLLSLPVSGSAVTPAQASLSGWDLAGLLFITGAVIMLIRFLFRIISLQKMKSKATQIDGGGRFFVYDINKPVIPFSFGRSIFINPRLHSKEEWKEIILHEYVHVRQHHTIDILLGELLCIVNWYNPFAWLIRFSIRQNLEFIADEQVIGNGSDKIEYQYHLLKVVGVNEYRIANSFNFSSLKKRIIMMNKSKSARLNLVRFLFIFPLLTILLLAFRNKYTAMAAENSKEATMAASAPKTASSDQGIAMENTLKPAAYKNKTMEPAAIKKMVFIPGVIPAKETVKEIAGGIDSVPVLRKSNDTIRFASGGGFICRHLEKVLYIIDNEKMPADFVPGKYTLEQGDITSLDILKDKAASLFGEKDCKDVVVIKTSRLPPNSNHKGVGGVTLGVPASDVNNVEYYINGLIASAEEARRVDPNAIASLRAGSGIKDVNKKPRYAIWIELKKKIQPGDSTKSIFHIDTLYEEPGQKSTGGSPLSPGYSKTISFSGGSSLSLGVSNMLPGTVAVTASGRTLTENKDYTVNYSQGTVAIVNDALLNSSTAINISFENVNHFRVEGFPLEGKKVLQSDTTDTTH